MQLKSAIPRGWEGPWSGLPEEQESCPHAPGGWSSRPGLPSLAPSALTEVSGLLWPLCSAVTSKEVRFFYDLAFLSAEVLGSSWCLAGYVGWPGDTDTGKRGKGAESWGLGTEARWDLTSRTFRCSHPAPGKRYTESAHLFQAKPEECLSLSELMEEPVSPSKEPPAQC